MFYEIYHLEAVDPAGRMFNRNINVSVDEYGYTGHFSYEAFSSQSGVYPSVDEALAEIAAKIKKKGFHDIRTRLNFREERYLAEREPWVYY